MRHPLHMVVASGAAAVLLLAGCDASPPPAADEATTSASTAAVSAAGVDVGHIHNIALDADALLLGTHEGLYRQQPGQQPVRVGEPFDVMGFTLGEGRWLASGHPGPGMDAPADLGLIESTDSGSSWRTLSMQGKADFHRLTSSGDTILGVNSGDGMLWRSADAGSTWKTHGMGPFDIALDPADGQQALATAQSGPTASTDGGQSFSALAGAPLTAYVAWTDSAAVAASPEGQILRSTDAGKTWQQVGSIDGQPAGLAARGDRVVVLQSDTIWESIDAGATFTARVTGLPTG